MSIKVLLMHDENHVHCALCDSIIFDMDALHDKTPSWSAFDIFKEITEGVNAHFNEKHSLYDE